MSTRLYVGNIPFNTTEAELAGTFEAFGTVDDIVVIMDKDTGRSRGFGFVTMTDDGEANEAIRQLNDSQFGGRRMVVSRAKERQPYTAVGRPVPTRERRERY